MGYKDYNVGQEYTFVRFDYVRAAKRIGGFNPVLDEVDRLHIETLECVEERPGIDEKPNWVFLDRFGELWRSREARKNAPAMENMLSIGPLENERMRELMPGQKLIGAFDLRHWLIALQKTMYDAVGQGTDEGEVNWEVAIVAAGRLALLLDATRFTLALHLGVLAEVSHSDVLAKSTMDDYHKNLSQFELLRFIRKTPSVGEEYLSRLSELHQRVNASDYALEVMKKITIV